MKPDWKDAPEWANYVAQDRDGYWCWYESHPHLPKDSDEWTAQGRSEYAVEPNHWKESLEKRPDGKYYCDVCNKTLETHSEGVYVHNEIEHPIDKIY